MQATGQCNGMPQMLPAGLLNQINAGNFIRTRKMVLQKNRLFHIQHKGAVIPLPFSFSYNRTQHNQTKKVHS